MSEEEFQRLMRELEKRMENDQKLQRALKKAQEAEAHIRKQEPTVRVTMK